MEMPKDFNEAQGFSSFEQLEVGGHICRIMKVEETKTKNGGKDMVVIYLDTDKTDKQPEYYTKQYQSNNKEDKKWSNNAIKRVPLDFINEEGNGVTQKLIDYVKPFIDEEEIAIKSAKLFLK